MKILLVDDHPVFFDGIKQVLPGLGAGVTTELAVDVEQAIKFLEEDDAIDLVLLDLNLPGINGGDLIFIMANRGWFIPVVVISAQYEAATILRVLDAGAMGFMPKSFSAAEILAALQLVLSGQVFIPSAMVSQIEQLRRVKAGTRPVVKSVQDFGITPSQLRVLELLCKGYRNEQIALALSRSINTVKSHVKEIYAALNVDNRMACIKQAQRRGLIPHVQDETVLTND